jgi:nucleoside-diphosphate-sugar epimerase
VEDIARGVIEIASQSPQQITEKFNLGAGVGKTLQQIVKEVVEDLGLAVRVEFGSIDSPEHDPRNLVADINKAKRVLDWAPATRLSYAVWELAQELFPALSVREPERWLCAPLAK